MEQMTTTPPSNEPGTVDETSLESLQYRLPVRVWTSPTGQGGYEIFRIHPRALLSAPWGTCTQDEIEVFYRTLVRLIEETEGGRTTLVLDYRRIVNAGPDQRKLFERSMESRRHLVGSLVFITNSPVLRLLVRLGRHFKRHGCELRICSTREEGIRIGCELASATDHGNPVAPSDKWLQGSFFSRFFLRRQVSELKSLLADFPWDSRKPVENPLPPSHPFHELFDLWWTVKREIDQVDKERQDFQDELGAALKTLGESEQRYRAIFLATGIPVLLFDQDRRIRMGNPAAQALFGKSGESNPWAGVDAIEFVHPDDRSRLLEYHERRLHDSRLPTRYPCRVIDAHGGVHSVEACIEIVVGTSLRVISLVDLTETQRLESEKDSLLGQLERVTAELEKLRSERNAPPASVQVGEALSIDRPGGLASASTAIARQAVLGTDPSSPSALRILVVEDDIPLSGVLREYLEAVGHDVRCTDGGTPALEILASSNEVDVVLLDLQMHDMDGLEVLRKLRMMPGRQTLPVIVLTGLAFDSDLRNCMEAGADRHVSKPFLMDDLVRNIVELHAARRSMSR